MENNKATHPTRERAKWELINRLKTMVIIATCFYLMLRMFLIGVDHVSNYKLIWQGIQAAFALYLPYKLGCKLTGSTCGGVIAGYLLLAVTGTWLADHELILWSLLTLGYTMDFGPWVRALLSDRQQRSGTSER